MTAQVEVRLPHEYTPRAYQQPFWTAMLGGCKDAVLVWHRRAGKDVTVLNWTIFASQVQRKGLYYYFFPTYAQGKKILWDGGADGTRYLERHIPPELVRHRNETEMQVEFVNGSILQIIGTDKMDRIVGTNPVGCVFSEWALQNPRALDLVRPILDENGGWAVFDYTPRGRNHGYKTWQIAQAEHGWFRQLLTVNDTLRDDGTPVIAQATIDRRRREGMPEELIQQEYYCSFEGGMEGAYFARQMNQAFVEQRITEVPWNPDLPVQTWWDIGVGDKNAIWFVQPSAARFNLIEYLEHHGEGFPYYAALLKDGARARYVYTHHYAPHDLSVKEWGTGRTRLEQAQSLNIHFEVAPKLLKDDQVNALRRILHRCWWDEKRTERGIACLINYRKEWDEDAQSFKDEPVHDWTSHGADAAMTGAVMARDTLEQGRRLRETADTAFNPLDEPTRRDQDADTDFEW